VRAGAEGVFILQFPRSFVAACRAGVEWAVPRGFEHATGPFVTDGEFESSGGRSAERRTPPHSYGV
jgi:hypothetical protein